MRLRSFLIGRGRQLSPQVRRLAFRLFQPARDVARWLAELDLSYVQFGLPAGDPAKGEKGLAALPDRVAEFRESVAAGLEAAPSAFIGMLQGKNFGKQVVKLL